MHYYNYAMDHGQILLMLSVICHVGLCQLHVRTVVITVTIGTTLVGDIVLDIGACLDESV